MLDLLFVYGTLRGNFDNPHARMLRANASFAGNATVRGSLHPLGEYMAFRPDAEGEVTGELYRLTNPESTLATLDAYEGDGYERVIVRAGAVDAWIYQFRQPA